ncbi:oxidoreductase [Mycolicibacterium phlei]|nr:F420-dependent glucose-6-phosphate dehydrogenase [Mycolicibacterium phlei]STZ17633.1 oxidoreductase [Mycolicibacterium phlei]
MTFPRACASAHDTPRIFPHLRTLTGPRPSVGDMTTDAHRSRRPRFGLVTGLPRPGAQMQAFARAVEAAGFDVLAFADHLVPMVPPLTGAAAAAAATERLHTATLVLNNDFRHPVDTARETAGLAVLSDGRFELGLGAGHMKSEYDAAGLRFDDAGVRVSRLEESAALIRALLDGEPVDLDGRHYCVRADPYQLLPAPPRRVPLLIGGNGTRVLRLAGRLADIAGLAGITHNRDATEVRLTHFGPQGLADRIAVVADAAGDRFERIELNALIQAVVATTEPRSAATELAATLRVSPDALLESPFVLIGTHEQMAEELVRRQQRFGVSYWTVFDELPGRPSAMPDIAEVIRLLR